MIGSLLYLTASRPDIAYAFGICARFQSDPHTSHLEATKRILKYVHRTSKTPLEDVSFLEIILYHGSLGAIFHEPVPKNVDSRDPATFAEHAPSAPKTHMSDMDFDDLDDVPLARLIKKSSVPDIAPERPIDPHVSVHSQESSSTEGVFVPTPSLQHTSNVKLGLSLYSFSVMFPVLNTISSGPNNDPASALADESTTSEKRIDVHNYEDELESANLDDHTGEIPVDADNNPTAPTETHAFPEESRPANKKLQQNRRNITTKTG
ncbi:envelope-like protein [Cucumis melo var. makuwa]|uniref:Envelope-like protein n=1 Tax=Cucumis melo var. makuwa TaxID=1194695 RepID=A0A5A7VKC8_CUCMM|nr:envelope-like protein [Cucumis melo var. makuwa]TYJ96567.1 envelope-like protein [Cucumis melo var. makuwa]